MTESALTSKGCRLLPSMLDYTGTNTPSRIFASIPRTYDIGDGFRDITHGEILNAVNSLAAWLTTRYGVSGEFETLAYIGVADLRYTLVFYAAVKCGYKILFPSSRNPTHQNVSLLEQTDCTKLFYSAEMASIAKEIQVTMGEGFLDINELATFDEWLEAYKNPYPFTKSFEEAKYDPILVLHSSGSTGAPKPITQTHQYFANCDRPLPQIPGRQNGGEILWNYEGGGFFLCPFPPYHLAGFISYIYHPVFGQSCSLLLGFPDRPTLPELVLWMMGQKRVRLLFTPPSIIEGMLSIDGAIDAIKRLDDIVYAGGPLEKSAGDLLANLTRLSPVYGATETATISCLVQPPETWQYMEFHPAWKVIMEPEIDGAYELVLKKDAEADKYRGIGGTILREKPEYRTRDLFLPHPEKPELWRFYGRNDDIIVFSNGQKWNPVPSENFIKSHGDVAGVLIIGDGRFQPAAIIEPKNEYLSSIDLVESLWPLVEQANRQSQAFGRLMRSKVTIVQPGDFVRAPKGTIVRSATAKKLNSVIERLYSEADDASTKGGKQFLHQNNDGHLKILEIVKNHTHEFKELATAHDEDDLFKCGLDSLMALELSKSIRTGLSTYFDHNQLSFISTFIIFRYPTINRIAEAISLGLWGQLGKEHLQTHEKDIERMIETYTSTNIPQRVASMSVKDGQVHIGLIGSTGFLGQGLLASILQRPEVIKITCFNRKPSAQQLHKDALVSLQTKADVEFKTMSLADMNIEEIQNQKGVFETLDTIIFSAWTVNFNQPLSFFEPQIRALSALCTVLVSCERSPRLFFVSSISSSLSENETSDSTQNTIPEKVLQNPSVPMAMGYSQSKYVAERVLEKFAQHTGLSVTILRLGQVAGTVIDDIRGRTSEASSTFTVWNEREWFPSVMKTSAHLGQIPSDLAPVDWIPVNFLTQVISELISHELLSKETTTLQVYNIVNPHQILWPKIVPTVQKLMVSKCTIVPFATWFKELKAKEVKDQAVEKYPALKLLDYLQASMKTSDRDYKIAIDRTIKASATISKMESVNEKWILQWLSSWGLTANQQASD